MESFQEIIIIFKYGTLGALGSFIHTVVGLDITAGMVALVQADMLFVQYYQTVGGCFCPGAGLGQF